MQKDVYLNLFRGNAPAKFLKMMRYINEINTAQLELILENIYEVSTEKIIISEDEMKEWCKKNNLNPVLTLNMINGISLIINKYTLEEITSEEVSTDIESLIKSKETRKIFCEYLIEKKDDFKKEILAGEGFRLPDISLNWRIDNRITDGKRKFINEYIFLCKIELNNSNESEMTFELNMQEFNIFKEKIDRAYEKMTELINNK